MQFNFLADFYSLCASVDSRSQSKQIYTSAALASENFELMVEQISRSLSEKHFQSCKATIAKGTKVAWLIKNLCVLQATHVITSHELLHKFKNILPHTPSVTTIIYFEHQIKSTNTTGFPENVTIVPFYDVVHNGRKLTKDVSVAPIQNAPTK